MFPCFLVNTAAAPAAAAAALGILGQQNLSPLDDILKTESTGIRLFAASTPFTVAFLSQAPAKWNVKHAVDTGRPV
uniref:Putative secreted protein n=1 Tax=Anopheles triannulatus TaxID=58253 RepID=A0A2M4B6F4_9DIPT